MPASQYRFRVGGIPDPDFDGATLDLGPAHPASAGMLELDIFVSENQITSADPLPGALHRGAELILAARDYRQALSLANRHDWQAPFFGEWALARLVEDALGIQVPERARWVRAILAEHTRVASHLAHLSFVAHRLANPALHTGEVREELRKRTAEVTGNRLHPMAVRLGGLACDVTRGWASVERATLTRAAALAARLTDALRAGLGSGVAVVTRADVDAHGLAGPVARASGVATDLRLLPDRPGGHEEPWRNLAALLTVPAPTTGDANARLSHLAAEVGASASMVGQLLDGLPEGPSQAHLPKVVKLPEGDWQGMVEAPLGRAGIVVTSRGEKTPWRLRLRTASFANVSSWPAVLPGTALADLDVAVASLPWVAGDLDK